MILNLSQYESELFPAQLSVEMKNLRTCLIYMVKSWHFSNRLQFILIDF